MTDWSMRFAVEHAARTVRVTVDAPDAAREMAHAVIRRDGVCIAEDWSDECGRITLHIFDAPQDVPQQYSLEVDFHGERVTQSFALRATETEAPEG